MGNNCSISDKDDLAEECLFNAHVVQQQASMHGCKVCPAAKFRNVPVGAAKTYERGAPVVDGVGRVFVLICALNYKNTRAPLECEADGECLLGLCSGCGTSGVTVLRDSVCTRDGVSGALRRLGAICGADDYIVFFYSGRCTRLGPNGTTKHEHQLCLVDDDGQLSLDSFVQGSELSKIIRKAIPEDVRLLILSESPHIVDVGSPEWEGREAISISGTSEYGGSKDGLMADTTSGGAFTHSICLAVERLQQLGEYDYSVGMLYNTVLEECARVFSYPCTITIQASASTACHELAWPLIPQRTYLAPLSVVAKVVDHNTEASMSDTRSQASSFHSPSKSSIGRRPGQGLLGIRSQLTRAVRPNTMPIPGTKLTTPKIYAKAVEPQQCSCM